MLKFEITRRSYSVEISDDDFDALSDTESYATDYVALRDGNKTLSEKLDGLPGVFDTEYDGHYGSNVFFTIDADDDKPKLHARIERTILSHLKWCRRQKPVDHVKTKCHCDRCKIERTFR